MYVGQIHSTTQRVPFITFTLILVLFLGIEIMGMSKPVLAASVHPVGALAPSMHPMSWYVHINCNDFSSGAQRGVEILYNYGSSKDCIHFTVFAGGWFSVNYPHASFITTNYLTPISFHLGGGGQAAICAQTPSGGCTIAWNSTDVPYSMWLYGYPIDSMTDV